MTGKTRLSGEKAKEKAKRATKEWKARILSKECLHGRAKAREMEKAKEGNHFNNDSHHKQALHRQHLLVRHKPPKNKKQPMLKKAGVMTMTPTGQMTGQDMNPTMDTMEITPKVIGTIGLALLSAEELTESEDKHSESSDVISGGRETYVRTCACRLCVCMHVCTGGCIYFCLQIFKYARPHICKYLYICF